MNHGFKCRFLEWVRRPRSFAADAQHCIMGSGSLIPTEYKAAARPFRAPHAGLSPLIVIPDHNKCAVVLEPVKDEGPCGWRFAPSLTASARAGHSFPADARKQAYEFLDRYLKK